MQPNPLSLDTKRLTHPPEDVPPVRPAPAPEPAAKPPLAEPLTDEGREALKQRVVEVLHTCFDPEIPVNIYELGLIYDIAVEPTGAILVKMTLTSPACPVAGTLPGEVQRKILTLDQATSARVDLVWEPPWDKDRMSEGAKLMLGIDD